MVPFNSEFSFSFSVSFVSSLSMFLYSETNSFSLSRSIYCKVRTYWLSASLNCCEDTDFGVFLALTDFGLLSGATFSLTGSEGSSTTAST